MCGSILSEVQQSSVLVVGGSSVIIGVHYGECVAFLIQGQITDPAYLQHLIIYPAVLSPGVRWGQKRYEVTELLFDIELWFAPHGFWTEILVFVAWWLIEELRNWSCVLCGTIKDQRKMVIHKFQLPGGNAWWRAMAKHVWHGSCPWCWSARRILLVWVLFAETPLWIKRNGNLQ